jgi:hypothetical protein
MLLLFRLTVGSLGTSTANMFAKSSDGSIYKKLFDNNMDNQSFIKTKLGLEAVLTEPKSTMFNSNQYILGYSKFHCKLIPVWVGNFPLNHISMAMRRNSPYKIFMRSKLLEMTDRGQLNQLLTKFKLKQPDCNPRFPRGKPLGLDKISLPFLITFFGAVCSLCIMIYEKIFWIPINRSGNGNIQNSPRFIGIRNDLDKQTKELKLALLNLHVEDRTLQLVDDFIQTLHNI